MQSFVRAAAFALVLSLASIATAQSTGSSFGGGSWDEGGGGGSSSSGGGWSSGYGSSSGSTASSDAIELRPGMQCVVAGAWVLVVYLIYRGWRRLIDPVPIDVVKVELVIDARARRFVQSKLEALAKSGRTQSRTGRAQLLAATTAALRASRIAWIYAGVSEHAPMPSAKAQAELQRLTNDARAAYQRELVRVADGKTVEGVADPALRPKEHEGEGVVLVTLLVAARGKLGHASASDPTAIDTLLAELGAIGAMQLVAIEVVWTPSADADRMSTAELEALHPTLTKLAPNVGRVFCSYCGGPFAGELAKCPHCGAPRGT